MDDHLFVTLNLALLGLLGLLALLYILFLTRKRLADNFLHQQEREAPIGWFKRFLSKMFRVKTSLK